MDGRNIWILSWIFGTCFCAICLANASEQSCLGYATVCGEGKCCCSETTADCEDRELTFIPELPFNTTTVRFNRNRIGNITTTTFENLKKIRLRKFYIQDNGIENVSPNAFAGLDNLTVLDISKNVNINKTALSLSFRSLQTKQNLSLELSEMNIANIPDDFFEGLVNISLQVLTLNDNLLTSLNECTFEKLKNLQTLELTNNMINNITGYAVSGLQKLEVLILNRNVFARNPPRMCRDNQAVSTSYPNLKTLMLNENFITIIPQNHWYCLPRLKELYLSGNLISVIKDNAFSSLQSLEFLDIAKMKGMLHKLEPNALNSTSLLDLRLNDNNMIFRDRFDTHIFKSCPNLQKLFLSNNDLQFNNDEAFLTKLLFPLVNLTHLYAIRLQLNTIPEGLLQQCSKLQRLLLDYNKINTWNHYTFENVTELRILSLQGNTIHTLNSEQFPDNLLQSLHILTLKNNPFSCTCENLWFRNWVNETLNKGKIKMVGWPSYYKCAKPPAWNKKMLHDYHPTEAECRGRDPMVVVYVTISSFLVVFTIVALLVYRQRWYICYWLYKLKRYQPKLRGTAAEPLLNQQEDGDEEQLYDAYVIYNDEDRQFVHRDLRMLAEEKHNKKLCIWHRDTQIGAKVDIFADSIYASKNIIAVISQNFVTDPWCQFQMDVALDRRVSLGRSCLLLVVLDNIKLPALNKTWCVILTKTPTVDWCADEGDIRHAVFEQKLLKALT